MSKPSPDYTVPKIAWRNVDDVRLDEMERLWRDGVIRLILRRDGKVTIR